MEPSQTKVFVESRDGDGSVQPDPRLRSFHKRFEQSRCHFFVLAYYPKLSIARQSYNDEIIGQSELVDF